VSIIPIPFQDFFLAPNVRPMGYPILKLCIKTLNIIYSDAYQNKEYLIT